MAVQLVCPTCRKLLQRNEAAWSCTDCRVSYVYSRGVLCFLDPGETLNETPFEDLQTKKWTDSALLRDRIRDSKFLSCLNRLRIQISMSGRRDRIFFQGLRKKSNGTTNLILDIGCGGGRHYLCNYGEVTGVDPVLGLLNVSKEIYGSVYQADAAALPFPDNSFDYVVSSDVIGHVVGETRNRIFSEMHRVLKKGGRTIHVIETDCNSYWFQLARELPEIFQERVVDRPGHIGLELPSKIHERFIKLGFKPVAVRPFTSDILTCGEISGMLGNAYEARRWWLKAVCGLDRLLAKNMAVCELVNVGLELAAQVADRLTPLDHSSGIRVIYEKQ